jgi:hypothetical protein
MRVLVSEGGGGTRRGVSGEDATTMYLAKTPVLDIAESQGISLSKVMSKKVEYRAN